jgi:hypothetical protein
LNASYTNGSLVTYTDANSGISAEGIVLSFSAEQQYVILLKDPDGEWDIVRAEVSEVSANTTDDPLTLPGNESGLPYVFVVAGFTEDSLPTLEVYHGIHALIADHPDWERAALGAVADPEEPMTVPDPVSTHIRFMPVKGVI